MRCMQPGCRGSIVDGYCDVCGMPAPGGASSAAAASVGGQRPPPFPVRPPGHHRARGGPRPHRPCPRRPWRRTRSGVA